VMRFEHGETIVEQDEVGTWFGVLLDGTLSCQISESVKITRAAGDLIGEMAMWQPGATRTATMVGDQPGLIATLLVSELGDFTEEFPELGYKLIRLMGYSAIHKQLDATRGLRASKFKPAITWLSSPSKAVMPLEALLRAQLLSKGFLEEEVLSLLACAQFYEFEAEATLLRPGLING